LIRVIPKKDKGKGEIVELQKKFVGQDGIISETNEKVNAAAQEVVYSFVYQQDTYTFDRKFSPLTTVKFLDSKNSYIRCI
jgi:hypothetical protein